MSTRCLTVFMDRNDQEICVMYGHYDGYYSGYGKDLADFLTGFVMVNGFSLNHPEKIANGMDCLAAQVVAHFKKEPGGFGLLPPGKRGVWEEYVYFVSGKIGEEPRIKVDEFDGFASEFNDFLIKKEQEESEE